MITGKAKFKYGAGLVILSLILWGVSSELSRGRLIDACVDDLVSVVSQKQEVELANRVRGRSLVKRLMSAHRVESVYARPKNDLWARVGLVVHSAGSSTSAHVLGLLLSLERLPTCEFVRDYESGAFGAHGRDSSTQTATRSQP